MLGPRGTDAYDVRSQRQAILRRHPPQNPHHAAVTLPMSLRPILIVTVPSWTVVLPPASVMTVRLGFLPIVLGRVIGNLTPPPHG